MAEPPSNPLQRPLPDGVVPEAVVARTESHWVMIMAAMLTVMMVVIVVTSVAGALHPSSNVEVIEPLTLHLGGEFVESNLGTAIEPDGSATVRLIGEQYDFVPHCVSVPADTPVKFRLTSADVVHGFLLPDTNINTMVVPGFVAEVRTSFRAAGRVRDAVSRVLRPRSSRHVDAGKRRTEGPIRGSGSAGKDALCKTVEVWRSVTTGWPSARSCRRCCWGPGRC